MTPERIDQPGSGERIYWRGCYWEIKRQRGNRVLLLWCIPDPNYRNRYKFALRWVKSPN